MEALHRGLVPQEAYQVALFERAGGHTVFLQDADPMALKPDKLAEVIVRVRERFPEVERVTTYGRGATLARRAADQLRLVREAGLTRVHVGLESGSDEVLKRMDKGCTADQYVEAGRHVLEAGLELCLYVMPGLGGRGEAAAAEHVAGTADVVRRVAAYGNADNPLVVRLRTAAVAAGTPLAEAARDGRFTLPDDVEIARELRDLLVALGDARLRLVSDHALNLLPEIEGVLPADRERLLAVVDEFLAMPPRERAEFVLGRRLGIYYSLESRRDPQAPRPVRVEPAARPLAQRARDARHGRRPALALHLRGARATRLSAPASRLGRGHRRSYTPTARKTRPRRPPRWPAAGCIPRAGPQRPCGKRRQWLGKR